MYKATIDNLTAYIKAPVYGAYPSQSEILLANGRYTCRGCAWERYEHLAEQIEHGERVYLMPNYGHACAHCGNTIDSH